MANEQEPIPFKIFKGLKDNIPKTYHNGSIYLTTDDGKLHIDTSDKAEGRIILNAEKADKDSKGNIIASTYLPLSGGTMTGNILFESKGIKVKAPNLDVPIWTVYSSTEGTFGFRMQYNGTGSGNDNTLTLIADNQEGEEAIAYKVQQDGVVSFPKTINGNAATATILKDTRTLTIGNTGKSFNGSANVSWSSNEVGFLDLINRGTEFEDGADLNEADYGNFYSNNSTKSETLVNPPVTSAGFRLITQRGYNSNQAIYRWQFAYSSSRAIFQRYKDNNSIWSEWGRIVLTTNKNAVGSVTQPAYINSTGIATACTAYADLLTAFSSATNTLTLTVGGTTKTATIINTITNTWTAGTTAGPKITTTINGKAGSAVAIPVASVSASGVVTTGSQRFRGTKTLEYPRISSNATRYQGFHYYTGADVKVGEHWLDQGDATNITKTQLYWRQWSPQSTATTTPTSYYETYYLPNCAVGLTANKSYEIFTSKSYSTLDGRYLKLSGGTMTGVLTFKNSTAKPEKGTVMNVIAGQYQNAAGNYYTIGLIDLIASAEADTTVSSGYARFGSHNGASFFTSGESGRTLPKVLAAAGTLGAENLFLTSDSSIIMYAGCANDAASYTKAMTVSSSKVTSHVPLYGAVWNDYAEYRICKENFKPGQVACENNDDTLSISEQRLQPGANIISDTFGFAIGETDEAKCPIAVSGRVLAYTYEPREEFSAGDAVCAGPNGTVSKMTRDEIKEYPERIIGTVSAVPDYETWGDENIPVNNRIWIKVK